MQSSSPIISVNVRDISTHQPHFAPYTTLTVNGVKIGILGYTTQSAAVGALSRTAPLPTAVIPAPVWPAAQGLG